MFGNRRKHSSSCLIYYFHSYINVSNQYCCFLQDEFPFCIFYFIKLLQVFIRLHIYSFKLHFYIACSFNYYPPKVLCINTVQVVSSFNRRFSKMAAEYSNKLKSKMYTSTRKSTFTLVTLQSFSISGVISAEKM